MNDVQIEVLKDIVSTLTAVKDNEEERYKHVINNGQGEHILIVNREQHLESMIDWAIDVIEQNFDVVGEE
ncbi:hypothetical protein ETI01_02245 [Macrococcoides caseolyticum]|nr:hypothetical protein [Macrococcus caseolyticus]TDM25916.1 hypothetical protein ETI01_02245 [Macrococcus caseolyticus]